MEYIADFVNLDFSSILASLFIILSAIIAMITMIGKFSEIIGKPVLWVKKKNEDHELLIVTAQNLSALQHKHEDDVKQSIRHDKLIKDDLLMVSDKMDSLSRQITVMQNKIDETEMAKLKDSIVNYYRKYKDIDVWSQLESDAFWDLFKRYEAHGGNGFIHQVVEPAMRELQIIG